jgi:hypothetical protein
MAANLVEQLGDQAWDAADFLNLPLPSQAPDRGGLP